MIVTGPVVIDSRQAVPGALFAALPGEHADGHDYAAAAAAKGAVAVLAARPLPEAGAPVIVVADVTLALGGLARAVLGRLPGATVVGITGSSGKTSTKDLTAQVVERLARPSRRRLAQQRDRPAADRAARRRGDKVPGP